MELSNAVNCSALGSIAKSPPNMKALPKLKNMVPIPAPKAVPGPKAADIARAGIAPTGPAVVHEPYNGWVYPDDPGRSERAHV